MQEDFEIKKTSNGIDFNLASIIFTIASAIVTFILVPSPYNYYLLVLSIILLIIAILNYVSKTFGIRNLAHRLYYSKKLGIQTISKKGNIDTIEFSKRVKKAKELKILSISAYGFIKNYSDVIKELLINCSTIKVLISQEGSKIVSQIEDLSSHFQKNLISEEIRQSKSMLYDIYYEVYQLKKGQPIGKIEIGSYDTHYKMPMIIIDDNFAKLTITLPPKRAMNSTSFELRKLDDDCLLTDTVKHFDTIWGYLKDHNKIKEIEFIEKPNVVFIDTDYYNCPSCKNEKVKYSVVFCFNYTSLTTSRVFGHITICSNCNNKQVNLSHSAIVYNYEGSFYYTDSIDLGNIDRLLFSSSNVLKYLELVDIPEKIKEEIREIAFK